MIRERLKTRKHDYLGRPYNKVENVPNEVEEEVQRQVYRGGVFPERTREIGFSRERGRKSGDMA